MNQRPGPDTWVGDKPRILIQKQTPTELHVFPPQSYRRARQKLQCHGSEYLSDLPEDPVDFFSVWSLELQPKVFFP